MSTLPDFAARSSVTLPEVLLNLPRQTEMPSGRPQARVGVFGRRVGLGEGRASQCRQDGGEGFSFMLVILVGWGWVTS
jgi:hypothetical protein